MIAAAAVITRAVGHHRGDQRCKPEPAERPAQPTRRGQVLQQADRCGTVHETDTGGLDQLPRLLHVLFADAGDVDRRCVVVAVEHRKPLPAVQSGDEACRRAAERAATVEQQQG
jgi:hypothetical protein